jgi:hypothetical protein
MQFSQSIKFFKVFPLMIFAIFAQPVSVMADQVVVQDGTPVPSETNLIVPRELYPIELESVTCEVEKDDKNRLIAAVEFKNVSNKTINAIKFYIKAIDSFGAVLDVETVYLNGTFSPNVLITPKYNILHEPGISTDNTSQTWEVPNMYPDKTHDFSVVVGKVRFSDDSIWEYSGGDEAPKAVLP